MPRGDCGWVGGLLTRLSHRSLELCVCVAQWCSLSLFCSALDSRCVFSLEFGGRLPKVCLSMLNIMQQDLG